MMTNIHEGRTRRFETLASAAACGKSLFIFDLQRFAEACVAVQEVDGNLVLTLPPFRKEGGELLELTDAGNNVYGTLKFDSKRDMEIDNKLTLNENAANLKEIKLSNMVWENGGNESVASGEKDALIIEGTVSAQCIFSGIPCGADIFYNGIEYGSRADNTALILGEDVNLLEGSVAVPAGIVLQTKGGKVATGDRLLEITADGVISRFTENYGRTFSTYDSNDTETVYRVAEDGSCLYAETEGRVVCYSYQQDGQNKCPKYIQAKDGEDIVKDSSGNSLSPILVKDSVSLNISDTSKPQTIKTTPGETKTPEKFDPKKDTIKVSDATGTLDADKLILTEDGQLTYGDSFAQGLADNGVVDLSNAEQGKKYYTATLTDKDGGNKQLVAWSGTQSATVDMRQETKGVIMKDGGNRVKDTFLGGKGKDDITLGTEDVAAGGKGNDNITMGKDASGAAVAIKNGDDHDKVTGFRFGFGEEANSVSLPGGMNQASIDSRGRLKVGTATLEFAGTDLKNSGQTDLLLKDSHGTHKTAIGTSLKAEDELADIYYGTGKEAEADFSSSGESDLVIDLNNSSHYGKTTASVYNVQKVKGSDAADNTMVGQDGKNNTLIAGDGGSNRLYGGKGGRDHLVGSSTSEDTFYFGADSGRDEIENFGEEDAIGLLGGNISKAGFDAGGRLKLEWQDEKGNSSRLVFADDMKDKTISYDLGDGLHGAKFGEKLTITDGTADFVDYYNSGSKKGDGELDISGGSDKKVWLDGSHGATFDGFRKIDATASTGNLELAGGEQGDSILGGRGESSLWGGAGGNDFLTGGSGYNEFYFGRGEGHDVITDSNNGDKVMLYNVALEDLDLARTGVGADGNMVLCLTDGSSLTIQNYSAQGASTFQLADSTWSYDRTSGVWSQE